MLTVKQNVAGSSPARGATSKQGKAPIPYGIGALAIISTTVHDYPQKSTATCVKACVNFAAQG